MNRVTLFQSDGNCAMISHADSSQDEQREVITLQNVYELASEIGEHFKKLIAEYGEQSNDHLIPSVVKVLEHLESTVTLREQDQANIEKLEKQIEELRIEKEEREHYHMKFFSQLEDLDESWRKENVELSQYVKHLRSENNRLVKSLNDSRTNSISDLKEEDDDYESMLKHTNPRIEKLKNRLSILSKEIDFKRSEVEALRSQNNSLLDENEILKNSLDSANPNIQENNNRTEKNNHYKERIKSLESEVELYKSLLKITTKEIKPNLSLYSRSSGSSPSDSTGNNVHTSSPSLNLHNTSHQQQPAHHQQRTQSPETETDNPTSLEHELSHSDERPVQGPLPREPAEKQWPRQSRIWSFFPRITQVLTGKSFV